MGSALTALSLRTWSRYVVPFTLLALLAYAPLLLLANRLSVPTSVDQARALAVITWILGSIAILLALGIVGAVAPTVRAVDAGSPPSQHAALLAGLRGLVSSIVPAGAAIFALLLGLGAVVVPGLVLAPLVALTAASTEIGLSARFADAAAVGRAHGRTIALVLVFMILVGVGVLVAVEHWAHLPLSKKASPALIAGTQRFPHVALPLLALLVPIAATVLAAIHTVARRR
ncbi:hypothetical protein BH11MYX2_BH11MYX2_36520 [soil metagenome]